MSGSKRIVKNTLFLYFRMLLIMGVTLYTSRVVLNQLGVSDFGIYSLVGGIVVLLGFFNAAMSAATQRYLSFDIGKGDMGRLKRTFSATLTIHFGIALLVLILAETIGFWYVNNRMVFPEERKIAVNIVYQFSVFTFLLNIIQVPYNALLIARERMNIYAYVGLLEVFLKLICVLLLVYWGQDKLVTYAVLTFITAFLIRLIYQVYCRRQFKESKYNFQYDGKYFKELISYSGWNLFGNIASVARGQGSNMVLNLFFGTIVNAAYGVTMQIQGAVQQFVNNFQMAVNPQIIKQYARGEIQGMQKLVYQSAKLSFFLTLVMIVPLIVNVHYILEAWLVEIPAHTEKLVSLCLLCILLDSISGPLMTGIQATGRIKTYQLVVGLLVLLNLPISYLLIKLEIADDPSIVFYVWLAVSFVSLFFRVFFLQRVLGFTKNDFFTSVLFRIIIVILPLAMLLHYLRYSLVASSFMEFLVYSLFLIFSVAICVLLIGLSRNERLFILKIKDKILKQK